MPMPSQPWRDALQPASFRGAGFYVEVSRPPLGRRNVVHEFPKQDTPFAEDMGRRARRYAITAHVIGPNYLDDRDALIDACEAGGPGLLTHPTLGDVLVNCDVCVPTETAERGGICTFELSFIESGGLPDTGVSDNTQAQAGSAGDNLGSAAAQAANNQTIST